MILAAFLLGAIFGAVALLALGLAASAGDADDFLESCDAFRIDERVYRLDEYR